MRSKHLAAGAAFLVAGLWAAGTASAAPTCTTNIFLGPDGDGVVQWSDLTAGTCVVSQNKIYGDFVAGNLPADTVLIFNLNSIGAIDHHQLSFDAAFKAGTTYTWGYNLFIDSTVGDPNTVITSVDADFTQTASGGNISTLDKSLNPAGDANIHEEKIGAIVQPGSVLSASFNPGITDLIINESLVDNGTISSVTNTITLFVPDRNPVPEPATLALLGAGLAGMGLLRRRRRR